SDSISDYYKSYFDNDCEGNCNDDCETECCDKIFNDTYKAEYYNSSSNYYYNRFNDNIILYKDRVAVVFCDLNSSLISEGL
ncbi:10035_t:CDS:2, partial [Funneliformis caledonium]